MKILKSVGLSILIVSVMALSHAVFAKGQGNGQGSNRETGRGTGPTIYVTSQGLYYDSIVVVESLPAKGRFQQLIAGETGLETEFGPGTPGHLGGRWWMDLNFDGVMDSGDLYFLCPLLGPGRSTP